MGRRSLLADVREHLASSRVVTLVGPGGVGKTRVAVRFAEVERRSYRDGCWVVPLAEVGVPELLEMTVAEALGLQGADRQWDVDALADFIADRAALLVLDNCEHLLPAVGELVQGLRAACRNLRFLLTSRRPLRLSGEDTVVVPPLSLPEEADVTTDPEALLHYESVLLFVDRATSADSEFQLNPDNAPDVVALARDLEGMPLAIELAAARVRAMSPVEIRDSLTERLQVLTTGYRDAADRHLTLRACVDWSYGLCTDLEQRLWARSSVFVGGFTLTAAAAVCAGDDLPAGDVRDLVNALVDQSVILAEHAGTGPTRYRMLADLRQFGLDRAEKDGELQGMRERHSSWCVALVAEFSNEDWGPRQPDWLRLLRPEHANLQAGLGYLVEAAQGAADGLTTARRLGLYWSACGLLDEGRHWLEIALATGAGTPHERALAMAVAARFAVLQHDRSRATELIQAGTVVARTIEDSRSLGLLQIPAAMLAVWAGTPTAAAEQADSVVALLRHAPDPSDELLALFVAGVCHGFAGDGVESADRHRRCINRADEVGERHLKALALTGLGEHELAAGRPEEAAVLFREAIAVSRELSDRLGLAVGLDSLGRVAVNEGRGERAALLLGAAEHVWDAVGMSETGNPFAFAPSRSDGLRQTRKALGKPRFREMFRRGAQLGLAGAVTLALDTDDTPAPPPSATIEPSPLTRRELEVADLVADGLSNPEIAARLVISVRTAQGHVENILRKLGFSSRSLIAAWVTQRRLAAESAKTAEPPLRR